MPVAYETDNDGEVFAGTSITFALTITSGNGLVALADMSDDGIAVSGITFNGLALTNLGIAEEAGASNWGQCEIWYRASPTQTTADVVVTYSASAIGCACAISYTGTAATPVADFTQATGSGGANATLTVPNAGADDFVVDIVRNTNTTATYAVGANQTVRMSRDPFYPVAVSDQDGADGGVMSWTITGGTEFVQAGCRVVASAAAGTFAKIVGERLGLAGGRGLAG